MALRIFNWRIDYVGEGRKAKAVFDQSRRTVTCGFSNVHFWPSACCILPWHSIHLLHLPVAIFAQNHVSYRACIGVLNFKKMVSQNCGLSLSP